MTSKVTKPNRRTKFKASFQLTWRIACFRVIGAACIAILGTNALVFAPAVPSTAFAQSGVTVPNLSGPTSQGGELGQYTNVYQGGHPSFWGDTTVLGLVVGLLLWIPLLIVFFGLWSGAAWANRWFKAPPSPSRYETIFLGVISGAILLILGPVIGHALR